MTAANEMFYAALTRSIVRDVPPEDAYVAPAVDEQDRLQAIYDDAYFDVMDGRDSDFWARNDWRTAMDRPEHDDEQELRLFVAVKVAASLIGASDADRWGVIERALRTEAETYAAHTRDKDAA